MGLGTNGLDGARIERLHGNRTVAATSLRWAHDRVKWAAMRYSGHTQEPVMSGPLAIRIAPGSSEEANRST
jgi:hypothetical protein